MKPWESVKERQSLCGWLDFNKGVVDGRTSIFRAINFCF